MSLLLAFLGKARINSETGKILRLKRDGTLRVAINGEPSVITALASAASVQLTAKATEGLLAYDFNLNPKPLLATAWSMSADGLRYTFALRPDVRFHDGKPFTSADAAFSILAAKQVHPRGRTTFANVVEVGTPDPMTIEVVLSKPAPYLLTALGSTETPMVPKHLYENTDIAQNPYNSAPVGTGPFRFKEWKRGSHILFERNPDYWDAPKPHFDRLVLLFHPDADTRATGLETGEIGLAPGAPVSFANLKRLAAMPHLAVEAAKGFQYENTVFYFEFNLERPELQDVRVRRAFAHAIDKSVIRDVVNFGHGNVISGPISARLTQFYIPDLPTYKPDPAEAEALLDEAGFRRGDDGVRLRFTMDYVPGGDSYKNAAAYIKQALAEIGIEISTRSQDFPSYMKRVYSDRDFDLAYYGASNLFDPTVGMQRLYWSKSFVSGVPFSNGSGYRNPDADALLEAAAVEIDPVKRQDLFRKFQQIIVSDLPNIGIISNLEYSIYNKEITGFAFDADGSNSSLANVRFIT